MAIKIVSGLATLIAIFLGFISTREGKFRYERSALIAAPADKIFPYISNFKLGGLWNPFERKDPNMKKIYSGADGQVGSVLEFDGNNDAGTGRLEMLEIIPNESVEMKLIMTKPIAANNLIEYRLTSEDSGTRFTWAMSGDGGFIGKLINFFIDCEKMVGDQMETGLIDLKAIVETPK